jgi:hypothetical protein
MTKITLALIAIGFPIAVIIVWPFKLMPEEIRRAASASSGSRKDVDFFSAFLKIALDRTKLSRSGVNKQGVSR